MANKTLTELRTSVRSLYGDEDGVTATDTEVDLFLKDGVNVVLARCPWVYVIAPTVIAVTTDVSGSFTFAVNVGQPWSVEVQESSGTYKLLQPGHPALFADPEFVVATSTNDIEVYVLDGNRIQFYPVYASAGPFNVRLSYGQGSIGSDFPSSGSAKLPNAFPVQAEEAAIIYAVQKLRERDNDLEGAAFIRSDFENRVMMLIAQKGRMQRGRVAVMFDDDQYILDATEGAW